MEQYNKIGIIGYGRFGKLWADILAQVKGNRIFVYDSDISSQPKIDNQNICVLQQEQLIDMDMVFFCVPISHLEKCLTENTAFLSPHAVVSDTCSVKEYPVEWMRSILNETQEILGLHPLFGPDSIDQKQHRKLVLCRERVSDENYAMIYNMFQQANLTLLEMSAEEHDKQAVFSQGLTHLVGRVLKKLPLQKGEVSTKGFEALLEIIEQTCNDSLDLFNDIQNYNKGSPDMWLQLQEALDRTLNEVKMSKR